MCIEMPRILGIEMPNTVQDRERIDHYDKINRIPPETLSKVMKSTVELLLSDQ